MKKEQSVFLHTLASPTQLPDLFQGPFLKGIGDPRIAIVGRSNVGKSSLINALIGGRLAQTSKQPGKTRSIHFYHWKAMRKVVADLPGYGYARASKVERDRWETFINPYFETDENLESALVLLDSRYGPTDIDEDAIRFLNLKNIPVTAAFTKVDTLKTQSQRALRQKEGRLALEKLGIGTQKTFWVSIRQASTLDALAQYLKIFES